MIKQYFWKTKEMSLQNTGSGNATRRAAIEALISKHTISTTPSIIAPGGAIEILLDQNLESGDEKEPTLSGF